MDYLIPGTLVKEISFRRLPYKDVQAYEIYGVFHDDNYASGLRTDLLETIDNPVMPNTYLKRITLSYTSNATWKLPSDAYLDRDHRFRLYFNNILISTMFYAYNHLNHFITLDTSARTYTNTDTLELEYYQDLIKTSVPVDADCNIKIKPIFRESYSYGSHNVII